MSSTSVKTKIKTNSSAISNMTNLLHNDLVSLKVSTSVIHELRDNYDDLSFPGGLKKGLDALDKLDPRAIENAICFLEINPYFHRSGYIKEEILTKLKKIKLTKDQSSRLRKVILNIVDNYYCREFRYYCKLAREIKTKEFIKDLEKRMESSDKDKAKRAKWMFEYIEK